MMFYFAWVNSTDTTFLPEFAREDEDMAFFSVDHEEGDQATATIDIRNPRVGLLSPGRKKWMWLSYRDNDGNLIPLLFGRIVGIPVNIQENIIQVTFLARPVDFDAQKRALADACKAQGAPYWDKVWIRPELYDNPDVILEARPELFHADRVSHVVSLSSILAGEDGTAVFGTGDIIAGTLNVSYGEPPLRHVDFEGEILWQQQAQGTVDATARLIQAFRIAGATDNNMVATYTGQGLYDDWPEPGDNIGGGWTVGMSMTIKSVDGTVSRHKYKSVTVKYDTVPETGIDSVTAVPFKIKFPLWRFLPFFPVTYEASRTKKEILKFRLSADVQSIMLDESETETFPLAFSSSTVTELIDGDCSNATMPIGSLSRRQYLPTARGHQSIEYPLMVARTLLLSRARTVIVEGDISFAQAAALSCRMSATINDPRLPGGTATGKIIGYSFGCNGDTGEITGSVKIACCIGKGNTVTALPGNPTYVDDDYVEDDYQAREGEMVAAVAGEVTYQPLTDAPNDDGVDFDNMTPDTIIESLTVTGGVSEQSAILSRSYIDITAATEALNAKYTEVDFRPVPVTGGPFEQTYNLIVSDLMVPKTIDLEALSS